MARFLEGGWQISPAGGCAIIDTLYIADRATVDHAADLMAAYGGTAGMEAAARADRSRDVGNLDHFCRWRQVERVILLLSTDFPLGTVH